jgi:addiction module RelE/StbE family toxin
MKLLFTQRAEHDLESIYFYFLDVAPYKADDILNEFMSRTEQLLQHPLSGPYDQFLKSWGFYYRCLVVGNYKIIYKVSKEIIYIIQVFDVRQAPEKSLPFDKP